MFNGASGFVIKQIILFTIENRVCSFDLEFYKDKVDGIKIGIFLIEDMLDHCV